MKRKNRYRRVVFLSIIILIAGAFLCIYQKKVQISSKIILEEKIRKAKKRGYDIPIKDKEKKESEQDCKKAMELTKDLYKTADKGTALNVVLSDETVLKMQNKIKNAQCPVTTTVLYSDMKNYQDMDRFLRKSLKGEKGSIDVV